MFDNVFVNPEAYKTFVNTGTWPDKTILVLEQRVARGKGSINQSGNFQGDVAGLELHVKDEARFPGKWAFFAFGGEKTAKAVPTSADCYSCHPNMRRWTPRSSSSIPRCCPLPKKSARFPPLT